MSANPGTCSVCGYALVQVVVGSHVLRTYHHVGALPPLFQCPKLIPLGHGYLSSDVPHEVFVPGRRPRITPEQTAALNRMEREA